jgi:hypothetical protein
MRPLVAALAAALLAPATASAAPFAELPFVTIPGGTSCVRATGAPGELVAWTPEGASFLRATSSGLTREPAAALGEPDSCPTAATQPNGAGVVAASVSGAVAVALREPGNAWGTPAKLVVPSTTAVSDLTTAVSERGDAVVVWTEMNFERRDLLTRIRVARRPAGGAFGAAQTLMSSDSPGFSASVDAGVAADGTAIVLWSHTAGGPTSYHAIADAAIAAPGAPFGAGQRLTASLGDGLALAVATDGRALAAFGEGTRVRIAERPPGGAFGSAQTLGSGDGSRLAVALGSGDQAFVAWGDPFNSDITYARRADASGFAPPIELTSPSLTSENIFGLEGLATGSVAVEESGGGGRPPDFAGADLRAAYAAGGRVVLSWGDRRERGGLRWAAAHVATVSTDDSFATEVLNGPLRDAETISPVVLENGVPAVAWGDNGRDDGRLHLAAEGATAAPPPAPRVRIGKPERTALRSTQSLVLPVTCSAACDIRATARSLTASESLTRAGTVRLRFSGEGYPATVRGGRVPITVHSGAPGDRDVTTQVVRPRLRRIPDPPMLHIAGLTAVRNGSTVTVTWRVDRSARGVAFAVYGSATRSGEPNGSPDIVEGSSQRTYSAQLTGVPSKVRFVQVAAQRRDGHTRHARVQIR